MNISRISSFHDNQQGYLDYLDIRDKQIYNNDDDLFIKLESQIAQNDSSNSLAEAGRERNDQLLQWMKQ